MRPTPGGGKEEGETLRTKVRKLLGLLGVEAGGDAWYYTYVLHGKTAKRNAQACVANVQDAEERLRIREPKMRAWKRQLAQWRAEAKTKGILTDIARGEAMLVRLRQNGTKLRRAAWESWAGRRPERTDAEIVFAVGERLTTGVVKAMVAHLDQLDTCPVCHTPTP